MSGKGHVLASWNEIEVWIQCKTKIEVEACCSLVFTTSSTATLDSVVLKKAATARVDTTSLHEHSWASQDKGGHERQESKGHGEMHFQNDSLVK